MSDGRGVRLRLLGAFTVDVDGRRVDAADWPSKRAAELVQLLALADGHRLLRDQVLEALWPHLEPNAAAANLRKAAHHARRVLGDHDATTLRGGAVALFPNRTVTTDVDEVEAALAAAARAGDDPAAWQAAADLHRGELLPDARYAAWAEEPRERLRSRRLDALRRAGAWREVLAEDPTDEDACRALMAASLSDGMPHAAVRWYNRLRTALHDDLGLRPSPPTQALYERCLAGLRRPDRPMLGRDVELAGAVAALDAAAEGRLTVLAVRGPGGIGKTTLCRELVETAARQGRLAVRVRVPRHAGPFGALATLVDVLLARDADLLEHVSPHAAAVLHELLGTPQDARLTGPVTRHQVIGAVRRLLVATSTRSGENPARPVVVLDDAHLADGDAVEALLYLAGVGDAPGPLVVLAYRPEQAAGALVDGVSRLDRAGVVATLDLPPLARADATALVHTAAPVPIDQPTLTRILDAAGGNPFFLLELARRAGRDGGTTGWDGVAARFLDVDPAVLDELRRLAVAGAELDLPAVLAVTGLGEDAAFALLDAALSAGVLVVAGSRYRFRHELVRQALVEALPPHRRSAVHRDAARRLASTDASPDAVAAHWLAGGRPAEAVQWLVEAARRAVRLGAFGDALQHADTVLGHTRDHPEGLRLRAEALEALGDERAPAAWGAAVGAASPEERDDLRAKQALAAVRAGDPASGKALLDGVEARTLDGQLAQALALSGAAAMGFADPVIGVETAARTRRLAVEAGNPSAVVIAAWAEAAAAHAKGDLPGNLQAVLRNTSSIPEQAITVFDGQLCVAERLLYGNQPYDTVIGFASGLAEEARRLGAGRGLAFATTFRGEALLLTGRLDEAEFDLTEGVHLHRAVGAVGGEALSLQRLAEVALHRDDRERAAALVDEALSVARESNLGFHLFDRIYGTKIAAAPDPARAMAALEEAETAVHGAMETCPGCRIALAVPAGIAAAQAGDVIRSRRYEEIAQRLTEILMRLPGWYAALDEMRGRRLLAEGDASAAVAMLHRACDGFRAAGQPLDAERCATAAQVAGQGVGG